MSRIVLTDSILETYVKMSDGNPGAVNALVELQQDIDKIDPQSALGILGVLMQLDSMEIYGTAIYILWNDKCGQDSRKMIMMLRANQLGFLSADKIFEMSQDQMNEIDLTKEEWNLLDDKVCTQLKDFERKV